MKPLRWQDWVSGLVGAWIFVCPWILPTTDAPHAALAWAAFNFWIVGVILMSHSFLEVSFFSAWEEWVLAVVGVWLAISPWILGYADQRSFMWSAVVSGLIVLGLCGWALRDARQSVT